MGEFIEYLKEQIGEPYVWGGQHTRLTPENYVRVIEKREAKTGGYNCGPTYAEAAIEYCRKKFEDGATVLYAYDCSGLGCYWLYNLEHLYKGDVKANTMKSRCKIVATPPKRGYWLFKCSGSRATHVAYMVSDTELIEARGRKYGVVRRAFNPQSADWSCWGIPLVFEKEIVAPEPVPTNKHVKVIGGSVNVRNAANTSGRVIYVAHRGEELPYIDTAETGWYNVRSPRGDGYITNLEKYTKLEGE